MPEGKHILIVPMDWGLGHATRCVPVIKECLASGHTVTIGGSGASGAWLQQEFPGCGYVEFPGYEISYSSRLPMAVQMLRKVPSILRSIDAEHRFLVGWCKAHQPDLIISDNRFGIYHPQIHSVFITHQLQIDGGALKLLEPLLLRMNMKYISRFNECWVPDLPGEANLAGRLSHLAELPGHVSYIGQLSRFKPGGHTGEYLYDVAVVLSGPEPLRTAWEKKISRMDFVRRYKTVIIRGSRTPADTSWPDGTEVVDMAGSAGLEQKVQASKLVISRSGYSSVMDWTMLQKQAILVPTPGQTEQEYLAGRLMQLGYFYSIPDEAPITANDIETAMKYTPPVLPGENLLHPVLNRLLAGV